MPKRTSSYHSWLIEKLKNPKRAESYLRTAMADSQEAFFVALRNVVESHRVSKVAEMAGLNRESLYRTLSEEGNPRYDTLSSVLSVLGIELTVKLKQATAFIPSEPSPQTQESEESASIRINLGTGNTLQSADLNFGLATLIVRGANNYQSTQDAAMADLPAAHMIAALNEQNNLLQEQLAGGA